MMSVFLLTLRTVVWNTVLLWPGVKVVLPSLNVLKHQGVSGLCKAVPLQGRLQLRLEKALFIQLFTAVSSVSGP